MSWDQGVQIREDLPEYFITWMEKIYERKYGEKGHIEYITWFGSDPDIIYVDFGNENSLEVNWGAFMKTDVAKRMFQKCE